MVKVVVITHYCSILVVSHLVVQSRYVSSIVLESSMLGVKVVSFCIGKNVCVVLRVVFSMV